MSERFDAHVRTYRADVDRAVGFIGQGHAFFAEVKVEHLLDLIARNLGPPAKIRALDIGCGVGLTDELLAPGLGELHGVDVAPAAVAAAAERNPSVRYHIGDGTHLPLPDESFDLALASTVLHHVPPTSWLTFVAEAARVLRPGGILALYEHNPANPLTRLAVARCEFDDDAVLIRRGTANRLCIRAGLVVVESEYILFLPLRARRVRSIERRLRRVPLGAQYVVAARRAA